MDPGTPTHRHRPRHPPRPEPSTGPVWLHSGWATMATDGCSEEPEGTRPHQVRQRGHSTCHILSIGPPPSLNFANLSAKKTLQPTRDHVDSLRQARPLTVAPTSAAS